MNFKNRLKKIGVSVEIGTNYPMVYLEEINGRKVKERFHSYHKWCFALLPKKDHQPIKFIDNRETFKLIRSYIRKDWFNNLIKRILS